MRLESEGDVRDWLIGSVGCDAVAVDRLIRLVALLRDENTRQNLVSKPSLDHVWTRHVADSAQLLRHVPRGTDPSPWLDLGTGAGFPGLVIAACRPDAAVVLVESRTKRIDWLERSVAALGLENVQVCGRRLEHVADRHFRVISARAFASLPLLIELATRFSTSDTLWLLPKGRSARQELGEMPKSVQKMFHVEQSLTDRDASILVGRGQPTPAKAPRR